MEKACLLFRSGCADKERSFSETPIEYHQSDRDAMSKGVGLRQSVVVPVAVQGPAAGNIEHHVPLRASELFCNRFGNLQDYLRLALADKTLEHGVRERRSTCPGPVHGDADSCEFQHYGLPAIHGLPPWHFSSGAFSIAPKRNAPEPSCTLVDNQFHFGQFWLAVGLSVSALFKRHEYVLPRRLLRNAVLS
jgi:hypothetical protein